MRTTKKILLSTASALAATAFASSAQAATPVGASTIINTGIVQATSTGAAFIFDVAGGTLNNSGTISNNNGTATAVTSAGNAGILINSGTIQASGVAVDMAGAGEFTNTASGIIRGGGGGVYFGAGATTLTATGFNNAGTIIASGVNTGVANAYAVRIGSGVSVTGGIINSGTIAASAAGARGILVDATASGAATPAITNSGTIIASGLQGVAIEYGAGISAHSIINTASGTINGGTGTNGYSISASGAGAVTLNNAGMITGSAVFGAGADSITNTGSIVGNVNLAAGNNSVTNSGRITGDITATGGNDSITNQATGVITGNLDLGEGTNIATNTGTITGNFVGGTGADTLTNDATTSVITGTIDLEEGENTVVNSGRFGNSFTGGTATDVLTNNAGASIVGAIDLEEGTNTVVNSGTFGSTFTGGTDADNLTNNASGVITGAIDLEEGTNTVVNFGTFGNSFTGGNNTDNLTNNAGASIVGAIDLQEGENTIINAGTFGNTLTGGTATDVLTNSGTITGAVDLEGGNDTITANTGSIFSAGLDGGGGNDVLNVAGTATNVGTVANIEDINHTAGTWNLNGAVTGGTTFDVSSGAILLLGNNVASTNFTNAGTVTLTASRTITGAYSQSGTLGVDFNTNGNSEVLTIAGGTNTAEFLPNAILDVTIASGVTTEAASNAAAYNVILGQAAASGVANLQVTSNNALVQFTATAVGNNVQLSTGRASADQAANNVLLGNGITSTAQLQTLAGGSQAGTNATNTLNGYASLLGALDSAGNTAEFNRINTAFNNLNSTQTAEALEDLSGDAGVTSANSFAVSAGVNQANGVIVAQLSDARTQMANAPQGAAAGDEFGSDLRVWAQPFAGTFEQDKKQGVEGFDSTTFGFAFGGDVSVSEKVRAGVAFAYTNTDVDGTGTNAQNGSDVDGYNLSLYGTYTPVTNLFFDAMVGFGLNRYETDRFVAFLGQRATADYDGEQYNFRIGGGYDIHTDSLIVTPGAYVTWSRINQDSFTETGAGGVSQNVNDQEVDRGQAGIDLTVAYPVQLQEGLFKPRVSVGYAREIGDQNVSSTQSFTGGGAAFTTRGADLDRNVGKFGLGADLETRSGTIFTLEGEYENRSTADGLSGFVRVKAPF